MLAGRLFEEDQVTKISLMYFEKRESIANERHALALGVFAMPANQSWVLLSKSSRNM